MFWTREGGAERVQQAKGVNVFFLNPFSATFELHNDLLGSRTPVVITMTLPTTVHLPAASFGPRDGQ